MKAMFEPQIILFREPDGDYTMQAVTLVPNSCFGAGPARLGVPPNVRLLPEVRSVLLEITHRDAMCLQFVRPVQHCLGDLSLGDAHGARTLTAFAMVDGKVVGSATLDLAHLGRVCPVHGGDRPAPLETSDWYAWENRMPGSTQTLHVQGVITVASPGYRVALAPAEAQGIDPRELILDLTIERLPGTWAQIVTRKPVEWELEGAAGSYDGVLLRLPDDSSVQLAIESVH